MDRQAPTGLPPTGPTGAWLRYKKQFITPDNVQNGVVFWNQYQDALNRAYQVYGVPPEIIVGIIGVETRWGRVMGKTRILDALATLSFSYPRRAPAGRPYSGAARPSGGSGCAAGAVSGVQRHLHGGPPRPRAGAGCRRRPL